MPKGGKKKGNILSTFVDDLSRVSFHLKRCLLLWLELTGIGWSVHTVSWFVIEFWNYGRCFR